MKKLLLLLASGSIAFMGNAQQRMVNFDVQHTQTRQTKMYANPEMRRAVKNTANKTTAAPNRTYSHWLLVDTVAVDGGMQTGNIAITMFQDDKHVAGFTSGYDTIDLVSAGAILHPQHASENNPTYFAGEMQITNSNAYIVDSVTIYGVYEFNPANTQVDTLVLSFVRGNGNNGPTGNGIFENGRIPGSHYGNIPVVSVRYDTTVLNQAKSAGVAQGTPNDLLWRIPLGPAAFGDTFSNGTWARTIALGATGISVNAGDQIAMSYSFRSGRVSVLPYDTVFYTGGVMKHNMWLPISKFVTSNGTSTGVEWPPYDSTDFNQGLFKSLPHNENGWSYTYLPQWAWNGTSTSGAWVGQTPLIDWHIRCATCGNVPTTPGSVNEIPQISKVDAYPNPASTELNVPFTLSKASNVTVTLSNILGQVIAEKKMGNVTTGKAVFNTASLTPGIYTYSVYADGQRHTGKVAIQ